ncbi:hypothetical protein VCRA2117O328_10184 [Vibrio crassostreae]|nr:hypothetical protein VCRA2117O328_10184 [Vibrio crassostreae]
MLQSENTLDYRRLQMKKILLAGLFAALLSGCSDNEVGDVSLGAFTLKDIHLFTNTITC